MRAVPWKPMTFFCLAWVGLLYPMAHAASTVVITADKQFDYAVQILDEGDCETAIFELRRFVQFFPEDPRVETAWLSMGNCYMRLNRHEQAVEAFRKIVDPVFTGEQAMTDVAAAALGQIAESYAARGLIDEAASVLETLARQAEQPRLRNDALYRLGILMMREERWQDATAAFERIAKDAEYDRQHLLTAVEEADEIRVKSPAAAGALSAVLPGSGYLYTGRPRDALIAFVVNALTIAATWEAFDSGNEPLGIGLGFLGLGFYSGNIYGAVNAAHKANRQALDRFIEEEAVEARRPLSTAPGVVLEVGFRF